MGSRALLSPSQFRGSASSSSQIGLFLLSPLWPMKKHKILAPCSHIPDLCILWTLLPCLLALAVSDSSVESWRMKSTVSVLLSSQELTGLWPSGLPTTSHRMESKRPKRLGFFHTAPSWVAKQVTLYSQISEWKWDIEFSMDFWFVGEFWLCLLILFQPNMSAFGFLKRFYICIYIHITYIYIYIYI
jgi:hypothetical protein